MLEKEKFPQDYFPEVGLVSVDINSRRPLSRLARCRASAMFNVAELPVK